MKPGFLVEERTLEANGESAALAVPAGVLLQLTLGIISATEQSSFDVAIHSSVDGTEWSAKPVAEFPQKFYKGVAAILLETKDAKFLQARWKMNRWGRGPLKPKFNVYLFVDELKA